MLRRLFRRQSANLIYACLCCLAASSAADAAPAALAWADNTPGNYEIFLKTSTDNGLTWSAQKRLTNNPGDSGLPSAAVSGNNIHVVWYDNSTGNLEVYFKTSPDNGATWSRTKKLTSGAGLSIYPPSVSVDGSIIQVAWNDNRTGNDEIYIRTSPNNGATWSAAKRLSYNAGNSVAPSVTSSGSNVYVVWKDYTPASPAIYFKASADNGATWSAVKNLTSGTPSSSMPSLAADGSNVYLAWVNTGNSEIYFRRSINKGATWSTAKRLTTNSGDSAVPSMAVSGQKIHVAWRDNTPGNHEVYYKTSPDKGVTWSAVKRLTNNSGSSAEPSVAADGSYVYVAWQDNTPGNHEIYVKTSADNGTTWSKAKRITNNIGVSVTASISAAPLISGAWAYQIIRHNALGWYVELSKVIFNADGTGSMTGSWNNNGTLSSGVTQTFTYTTAPNGDGSFNIVLTMPGETSIGRFVMSDDASMMVADGTALSDEQRLMTFMKLDAAKTYSNADLSGQYLGGGYEYYAPTSSYRTRSFFDTADGAGTYTVNATLNQNGSIITQSDPVTYSVDAGGKTTLSEGPSFMISGDGKLIVYANTDNASDYESGVSMKQDKVYSTANIAGKWAIVSFGDDDNGNSFVASIGTMTCNSAGSCSLSMKAQRNGTVSYPAVPVTFAVSSNGTFGKSFSAGSPAYAGAIGNGGNTIIFNVSFIETDPKYPDHREVFIGIRCSGCSNIEGL